MYVDRKLKEVSDELAIDTYDDAGLFV